MYRLIFASLMWLSTSQLFAAPDGKVLYVRHCNACHQLEGSGGIGLPLTADKLSDVSNAYLYKTIRLGRPGRVMPAFSQMSDAQVKAIIQHLRERTHTQDKVFEQTPVQGDAEQGKQLYATHCTTCHGSDGSGAGKGTGVTLSRKRAFLVMPPAISNPGFQASASDQMIKHIIQVGRLQSGMPAFAERDLQDQDFNNLVAYLRLLGKQAKSTDLYPDEPLSHVYESPYDFATTVQNVKNALTGANFRIFPERFLEQGAFDEFSVNEQQIGIRFCNFNDLYGMLKIEPRLGVVLPCRITILQQEDQRVLLVAPNLKVVAHWFNNDELSDVWQRMQETFDEIIEEATI